MKTCPVCSALCTEIQTHCPECGAELIVKEEIKSSGLLSLKSAEEAAKKKSSGQSLGTTVSTGSGLTNILRREDDDYEDDAPYIQGSIPTAFQKNGSYETSGTSAYERRREDKKVVGTIIKLVLLIAVAFGIYSYVTNVLLVEKGAKSYQDALKIYVDCINSKDAEKLAEITPSYYGNQEDTAEKWIAYMNNAKITSSDIISAEKMDPNDLNDLQEYIKLTYSKTLYATDTASLVVEMKGEATNTTGAKFATGGRITMEFLEIDGKWYFNPESYDNKYFVNEK